jgi:hypothetical protein
MEGCHGLQLDDDAMMSIRGSFFVLVFRRNAARQRRKEELGEQARSQSSLPSREPSREFDRPNFASERIEAGASPVLVFPTGGTV